MGDSVLWSSLTSLCKDCGWRVNAWLNISDSVSVCQSRKSQQIFPGLLTRWTPNIHLKVATIFSPAPQEHLIFDCICHQKNACNKSRPSAIAHWFPTTFLPDTHPAYPWEYWPQDDSRSVCGYVGLTNLGATCYMASCMQQLFMMPETRAPILEAKVCACCVFVCVYVCLWVLIPWR